MRAVLGVRSLRAATLAALVLTAASPAGAELRVSDLDLRTRRRVA